MIAENKFGLLSLTLWINRHKMISILCYEAMVDGSRFNFRTLIIVNITWWSQCDFAFTIWTDWVEITFKTRYQAFVDIIHNKKQLDPLGRSKSLLTQWAAWPIKTPRLNLTNRTGFLQLFATVLKPILGPFNRFYILTSLKTIV